MIFSQSYLLLTISCHTVYMIYLKSELSIYCVSSLPYTSFISHCFTAQYRESNIKFIKERRTMFVEHDPSFFYKRLSFPINI